MENSVSIIEHNHIAEMHANLKQKLMESQRQDQGRMDSVRASILGAIVGERYDGAKAELTDYVEMRTNFPEFQFRANRYVQHCCDLIQAIQTKRNFPGLAALSLAKQQEIHEKVLEHFEELKQNLKHLERVEREFRLSDVRSTVWVLRTASQVVGAILAVAFLLDLKSGMFSSAIKVVDSTMDIASTWVVNLIGF